MLVRAALLVFVIAAPLVAADLPDRVVNHRAANCPRTSSYLADQASNFRGQPLTPRKLTELPRAIGYMAVYREIGGCEAPLTMVEYRNPRRR